MLALTVALHVLAAPLRQSAPTPELPGLLIQFLALSGTAALVAALVNVLKTARVVEDGQAPTFSLIFNLVGFVALVILRVFWPDTDVLGLDGIAATLAQVLTLIVGLVVQLAGSKAAHAGLRGLPIIGKSYSPPIQTLVVTSSLDAPNSPK